MCASRCVDYAEMAVETLAPEDTRAVARRLAELLRPGDLVALVGPLGAGKTCFVQGLAAGLDVAGHAPVVSPTFVLHAVYRGRLTLHHLDGYRLRGAADVADLGFEELYESGDVVAVEWPDRLGPAAPAEALAVMFTIESPTRRTLRFAPRPAHARGPTALLARFCAESPSPFRRGLG